MERTKRWGKKKKKRESDEVNLGWSCRNHIELKGTVTKVCLSHHVSHSIYICPILAKESLSFDQTTSTIVEEHTISVNVSTIEKVPTSTTFVSIESPLQRRAQISSVTAHAHANATVHRERAKSADHNLGSNQFASLVSSDEEEDLSDSDNESDSMDLMTHSDKESFERGRLNHQKRLRRCMDKPHVVERAEAVGNEVVVANCLLSNIIE
ncbi:unnamed protein product [Arabidopsis lyrata]|uniref:Predicted protein n=1 Tax=Arabidopsis lyrata subsp. lyrata TaxID=81972 RepID=D7KVR5_ARALL|nr:predicted protein [Arabidopsis lyrata subsp. lyrata]CAH8257430.1 unnamed protein product [Arabidopsis lyrata]